MRKPKKQKGSITWAFLVVTGKAPKTEAGWRVVAAANSAGKRRVAWTGRRGVEKKKIGLRATGWQ